MGHSFGAFISSKYALLRPENINKLVLFSPWASESIGEEHIQELDDNINNMPFFRRTLFKTASKLYKGGATPFGAARKAGGLLGGYFVKRFAARRFAGELEGEELETFKEYMKQIIMRKGSSEYAFGQMFPNFMISEHAISNHIEDYKELGIEISFYYGTEDWMDTKYNGKRISKQLKDLDQKVYIVPDAGHHIYFGNPDEAFDQIYDDFCTSPNVVMT